MAEWHTVVPLSNLELPEGMKVEFAEGVVLGPKPDWVLKEKMIENCGKWDRTAVEEASAALTVVYEAASFGDPDPDWPGPGRRSIQNTKYDLCLLANLALWISRPSPASFRVLLHAPKFGEEPMAQHVACGISPILCHPNDTGTRLTAEDLAVAARLHESLVSAFRKGSIWNAARSISAALQLNREDGRYLFFWVALEALFGPDSPGETTHKISQRIAFFLEKDRAKAKGVFMAAKKGYGFRSKIAHGGWKEDEDGLTRMAEVEALVRRALLKILSDEELVKTFTAKGEKREAFLADLVFLN